MTELLKDKGKRVLLLTQCILMAAAVLYWLANRGNAFHKTFAPEEFLVRENTLVAQDVTTDEARSTGGVFMESPRTALPRGVYQVEISYNANCPDSRILVNSESLDDGRIHCADMVLNPNLHHVSATLELTADADDIVISADFSGSGYLSITGVGISETSAVYKRTLFYAFLLCLLLSAAYLFLHGDRTTKGVMVSLACIFVVSCSLLFRDHLLYADDFYFHLLRIEGIQKGLYSGTFPVKIYPVLARGYGYATGIFYGDAALYFPAFLRLLGFSVQSAYQYFIAALNMGTVTISYFSFRRMFRSRGLGVLGSAFCTLNHYRLFDVYHRAAIGECLGLMLFPLVLLSFYLIFMEASGQNWKKYALLTAFGMTGLIQSHILSCEMIFILVLAACIVFLRRTFRKYCFLALLSAAVLSVFLNLGFLVPFFDFYHDDILIASPLWEDTIGISILTQGLDFRQLFTLIQPRGETYISLRSRLLMPQLGIGMVFAAGLAFYPATLAIQCRKRLRDRNFLPSLFCFIIGGLLLFMSTSLFPWRALSETGALAQKLCYSLQFPWRLLAPASVLLTFTICYSIDILRKHTNKTMAMTAALLFTMMLLFHCAWFFLGQNHTGAPRYIYATEDLDTMLLGTCDYLPTVTDPGEMEEGRINQSGIISLDAYDKRGTQIRCRVSTGTGEGAYIEFPLNYYRHYACTDDAGLSLPVSSGYNGMLRVSFPENYSGEILVSFREPLCWRIAELISLITGLGSLSALLHCRRKSRCPET